MKDLQVKYTDPLDLIPYENNPRNPYEMSKRRRKGQKGGKEA